MGAPFVGSSSEVSRGQLRSARYTRLSRDVYVLATAGDGLATRVQGALTVFPEATVCLSTATTLLKLPCDDDGLVHLDRGLKAPRSKRPGIRTHRLAIPEQRTLVVGGVRVADGPRCFADLSEQLDLEALVALGDAVLRRWKAEEVAAAVLDHGRRRGAVLLRQAVPLLDARSDSPAESRARLRLHAAGFTGMVHGVVVRDAAGGWLAAPDLADERARVALQHEGEVHFLKGVTQRRHDIGRDELTREQGYEVVVTTAHDDARPERMLQRVRAAYLRAAHRWGVQVLPPHMR